MSTAKTDPVKIDPAKTQDEERNPSMNTEPKETLSETQHAVLIDGEEISYTATTGTILLKEDDETPKASVFFTAYTKNGVEDLGERPITFSFNGGPGSSSVWLHLGTLGPRRVLMGDDDGHAPKPPYRLINNDYSILDKTDLVFIDPVSTGYSRPVPGEKEDQFHGFQNDIESVGKFIRLYTTRYQRWASAKFLIGESYGTTRAAGLSDHLQEQCGMYLNGIMLVSSILQLQTARFVPGNDLPFILFLPTYTASAWYHGKLADDLQGDLRTTLDQAEAFAQGDYTLALMKGAKLSQEEREATITQLARFTGLSPEYIDRTDLRISIFRFVKELLRDEKRTVGRFDSRFKGIDRDAAGENFEYDPVHAGIQGVYATCLNHYLRAELGFESDLPYQILSRLYMTWEFSKNQFLNTGETLRAAMTKNPHLKVFVGNGYYDLATPYFATEYTFNHLGLDASLQENISMSYYEAGHMMYVHKASLVQLKADLAAFIDSAA